MDRRYRLSTDMSDFVTKEEKHDEWAETKAVYNDFCNAIVENHNAWERKRKMGVERVKRYNRLYGRKRSVVSAPIITSILRKY